LDRLKLIYAKLTQLDTRIYIYVRVFPSEKKEMGQCRHAKNAVPGKRLLMGALIVEHANSLRITSVGASSGHSAESVQ
jgi:hypothetical protein